MTTLITVGNSEGTRRCDATCHDAKRPLCTCVCGGRNHGVGLQQARKNTKTMAKELVDRAKVLSGAGRKGIAVTELDTKTRFPGMTVADVR